MDSFQPSRQIFQNPIPLSQGAHVINIAEREDGTRVQSLTLTQGMNTCRFVPPPPRCTGLPGATAVAGCAQINGFTYFASPAPGYAVAPQDAGAVGFCTANGTMGGNPSGDLVCGTLTFSIQCAAATTIQVRLGCCVLLSPPLCFLALATLLRAHMFVWISHDELNSLPI